MKKVAIIFCAGAICGAAALFFLDEWLLGRGR